MKKCNKCGEEFPATTEFFYKAKNSLRGDCKGCKQKQASDFRVENPGYDKRRYEKTRDRQLELSRKWYQENKEHVAAYNKKYKEENIEAVREKNRRWEEKNKEKRRKQQREWTENNRERYNAKMRKMNAKRDAIKRGATTAEKFGREDVLEKWGTDCHICDELVDLEDWHMEHVVPLSKGGPHTLENVKPAHPICNLQKGTKPVV